MVFNEFEIINHYFNRNQNSNQDIIIGIGDDCALLSINNKKIAISTDTMVVGTHFSPDINPADLGYKSLAVNLSDLAAMGAKPIWSMLALTIPIIDKDWLSSYSDSLFKYLDYYNMQLIGGNITRGPLNLTMTVYGLLPNNSNNILKRSGARVGDLIYVTGTLGDSAAGLAIIQNRLKINNEYDKKYLITRHLRPQPRILHGQALLNLATSAIDISDGTLVDLSNILSCSKCGAQIFLDRIPGSSALKRNTTFKQFLNLALNGGEDYELCFTLPKTNYNLLNIALKDTKIQLTCIGKIINSLNNEIQFTYHGQSIKYKWTSYNHFK